MAYTSNFVLKIDNTKCGASDSSNFPMLFSGTYAGGAGISDLRVIGSGGVVTNSSGFDIVFTSDAAGNNLLSWEIESYTGTTGAVVFWIKIPTLTHAVNTVIYMWAGNAAITTFQGGSAGAAWDSSFAFVGHISTANPNLDSSLSPVAINSHTETSGTGQIDGCGLFSGSQFMAWNPVNKLKITPSITLSAWVMPTVTPSGLAVIGHGSFDYYLLIGEAHAGDIAFYNGAGWKNTVAGVGVTKNVWNHIAVTHDGTNDLFYLNGALVGTVADAGVLPTSNNALSVAVIQGGFSFYTGSIDEIHVASSIRSVDWLLSEYNNQFSPSIFYTLTPANIFVPMCGAFGIGI